MENKLSELSELSKPVMYSLRFRNMHTGEPYKNINADTTFSTLEKAKAYGLGTRYVTQDDGKMVRVRDTSRDPIVEPLYSQEYVSTLTQRIAELEEEFAFIMGQNDGMVRELEAKDKRILELDYLRLSACEVFKEIGSELGCNPDNESIMMAIDELKKRLATPVRLPNKSDDEFWFDGVFQVAKFDRAVERAVRAAGFTVGDE